MLRHVWRNWLIEAFERAKEEARKKVEEGWERREREARITQEDLNVDESLAEEVKENGVTAWSKQGYNYDRSEWVLVCSALCILKAIICYIDAWRMWEDV